MPRRRKSLAHDTHEVQAAGKVPAVDGKKMRARLASIGPA